MMEPNFSKYNDGMVPAIIQDANRGAVLMLGYMNKEAYDKTVSEKKVTFFSRSKNRLWTKGEESGNFLLVENILLDCDQDALLIHVKPLGPVCHVGTYTCFGDQTKEFGFLNELEIIIKDRFDHPDEKSYTSKLVSKGINKVAQKVGEEAVELVIEAKDNNKELFLGEAADLLFHYLILLKAKNSSLAEVEKVLMDRNKK